jgi:hypothetical protein
MFENENVTHKVNEFEVNEARDIPVPHFLAFDLNYSQEINTV